MSCVAVCCSVLRRVAGALQCMSYREIHCKLPRIDRACRMACVAVCCSVQSKFERAAVCGSLLWCVAGYCSTLQCVACVAVFATYILSLPSGLCCSVLQCVAVCYSVLQCFAVCCSVLYSVAVFATYSSSLPSSLCCSVLKCVAVWCSVLQCDAVCCNVMQFVQYVQCVAVCCSVLQCAALCCSLLRFIAVCCRVAYGRIMSHMRIRHVTRITHMNTSCHAHE